jgi:hypothetical protein
MSAAKLHIGTRVWVRELRKKVQYNGLEGVIRARVGDVSSERFLVRLDEGAKELSLHGKNLMALTSLPVYSGESPKFMDPSHRLVPSHEYVSIMQEAGKGEGVCAIKALRAGDRIVKRNDSTQTALLLPSTFGLAYTDSGSQLQTNTENCIVYHSERIQELVDVTYHDLLRLGKVCYKGARYAGSICGNGGCSLCGCSALALAALHYCKLENMQNTTSAVNTWLKDLYVDEQIILSSIQVTEILMLIDFIQKTSVGLEEATRVEWVDYCWRLVAVWKINGVAAYLPLDDMDQLLDPFHVQRKKDMVQNLKIWQDEVDITTAKMQRLDGAHIEQQRVLEKHALCILKRISDVSSFLGSRDKGSMHREDNVLGHAVLVNLHEPHVSKINGAKKDDPANCSFKFYVHKPAGNVDIVKDTRTFILVEKDIPAGTFLCVAYNGHEKLQDYFDQPAAVNIKAQVKQSSVIVSVVKSILRNDIKWLPVYIVKHLQEAVQSVEA